MIPKKLKAYDATKISHVYLVEEEPLRNEKEHLIIVFDNGYEFALEPDQTEEVMEVLNQLITVEILK